MECLIIGVHFDYFFLWTTNSILIAGFSSMFARTYSLAAKYDIKHFIKHVSSFLFSYIVPLHSQMRFDDLQWYSWDFWFRVLHYLLERVPWLHLLWQCWTEQSRASWIVFTDQGQLNKVSWLQFRYRANSINLLTNINFILILYYLLQFRKMKLDAITWLVRYVRQSSAGNVWKSWMIIRIRPNSRDIFPDANYSTLS